MALSWHPGPGPSFADDLSTYDFVTDSYLHGLSHTLRVMHHVLRIAAAGGPDLFPAQTVREAFCAALLHDTARRHDGHCLPHPTTQTQTQTQTLTSTPSWFPVL